MATPAQIWATVCTGIFCSGALRTHGIAIGSAFTMVGAAGVFHWWDLTPSWMKMCYTVGIPAFLIFEEYRRIKMKSQTFIDENNNKIRTELKKRRKEDGIEN